MKTVKGDLLTLAMNGEFDAIVHGCNCFWNMGGGIARQIADQFPRAMATDILFSENGDERKMGTYTYALITGDHCPFIVLNAYTQFNGGADVNYNAIMRVMEKINQDFKGKKIGFPAIGAGIAGGDWDFISKIIEKSLIDVDATYVEYKPEEERFFPEHPDQNYLTTIDNNYYTGNTIMNKKTILPKIEEHDMIETMENKKGTVIHLYKNAPRCDVLVVEFENDVKEISLSNIKAVFNGDGTPKEC